MRLILVRHGHAGRKVDWHLADKLRPLSSRGIRQAQAVVSSVARLRPTRIISSPHVRCIQTAEPLAAATSLRIERSSALVPDTPAKALRLLRTLTKTDGTNGAVIVTHGEVIGDVLRKVAKEDGIKLQHRPPGLKGCVWVLEFRAGRLRSARYTPPL